MSNGPEYIQGKRKEERKKNYTHTKYPNEKCRISVICRCTSEHTPVIHLIRSVCELTKLSG